MIINSSDSDKASVINSCITARTTVITNGAFYRQYNGTATMVEYDGDATVTDMIFCEKFDAEEDFKDKAKEHRERKFKKMQWRKDMKSGKCKR